MSKDKQPYYSETYGPDEEGGEGSKRPKEFPMGTVGVEVYKPDKFSMHDLAGEMLHLDPVANRIREEIKPTFNEEQLGILKAQPDYQDTEGTLSEDKRLNNVTDALLRGYTVGQWPKEAIDELKLSDKQKTLLETLNHYMKHKEE